MPEKYDVFDVACGEATFGVLLKPESLNRILCPKCKTPQYIFVTKNLDILNFRENEICPDCKLSGKCKQCKGTGKRICPVCSGYGKIRLGPRPSACFDCEDCEGSGTVKCPDCNETGICPTCNGMRFIITREGD